MLNSMKTNLYLLEWEVILKRKKMTGHKGDLQVH